MQEAHIRPTAHSGASGDPERLDSHVRGNDGLSRWLFVPLPAVIPTAALAHPGDHSSFTWTTFSAHLLEPDHLIFVVLIIVVGFIAFRAGRRAERQAQERRRP